MHLLTVFADLALLPDGWHRDVRIEIGPDGTIIAVTVGAGPGGAARLRGPVIPGMPNLHSHAFQRAMAGLAERSGGQGDDSFWTWRQVMYGFLDRLTPDHVEVIAGLLYAEFLRHGFTAVAEFHYLHNDPAGQPYADRAEMAHRILAAAKRTGIGLTLLPVLYAHSDFGGIPPRPGQRRFLSDVDGLMAIRDRAATAADADPQVCLGVAPHSLRAVTPEMLRDVLAAQDTRDPTAPIHIHAAEQLREVEASLAWSGRRPVQWLLDEAGLSPRWCLVHATHLDAGEIRRLAACGAVAGLCPTTEGNLGDGFFPAPEFLAAGGRFGIGTDSHVSTSPIEELRWLEYGQRLNMQRRNVLAAPGSPSVGARLYEAALAGGAQALGRPIGRLESRCRADLVVLDAESPALLGHGPATLLDALVFCGNDNPVRDVMVGGRWVVRDGVHPEEAGLRRDFAAVLSHLKD